MVERRSSFIRFKELQVLRKSGLMSSKTFPSLRDYTSSKIQQQFSRLAVALSKPIRYPTLSLVDWVNCSQNRSRLLPL